LRWHYTEVSSPDNSYEQQMLAMVQNGHYKIGFETWSVYQNNVINSSPDIIIQWKGAALNAIQSIFVDSLTQASTTTNDKFLTWLKTFSNGATIINYQHCVNEVWFPVESIDCSGNAYRAFMQYLNEQGLWCIDGRNLFESPIDITTFNTGNQFLITLNLRCAPYIVGDKSEPFNNINTSTSTSNTLLRLQLTGAPPGQTVIYHIVSNNLLICANSNGTLYKKW